jgi:tRNA wybutosine-synthesizing protein 1
MGLTEDFEERGYRFCGTGAVEVCRWTKNALTGRGPCYKQEFYGVPCHRCMEFSPAALWCTNNCSYCWRPREFLSVPEPDDWTAPGEMVESLVESRRQLLSGFKGRPGTDLPMWQEAQEPAHFAVSLSGEPALYPHLPELFRYLNRRPGTFSTFLVTNGQHPGALERLQGDALPTQVYLSLTAPTPELYRRVSAPALPDAWDRLMRSCGFLSRAATRTVARITVIKGVNDSHVAGWRELLRRCGPHFVEFKGYSWIGFSKRRLGLENKPSMEEVDAFAARVMEGLPYGPMGAQPRSRIVAYHGVESRFPRLIAGKGL